MKQKKRIHQHRFFKHKPHVFFHGTPYSLALEIKKTGLFKRGSLVVDPRRAIGYELGLQKPQALMGGAALIAVEVPKPPRDPLTGKPLKFFSVGFQGASGYLVDVTSPLRLDPKKIKVMKLRDVF